jgi:hypothetical protein
MGNGNLHSLWWNENICRPLGLIKSMGFQMSADPPLDHQVDEQGASEAEVQWGMIVTGLIMVIMLALVVWTVR